METSVKSLLVLDMYGTVVPLQYILVVSLCVLKCEINFVDGNSANVHPPSMPDAVITLCHDHFIKLSRASSHKHPALW